jgi:hypothetical protein
VGADSADNMNMNVDEHEHMSPARCISRPDVHASGKALNKKPPVVCSIQLIQGDTVTTPPKAPNQAQIDEYKMTR